MNYLDHGHIKGKKWSQNSQSVFKSQKELPIHSNALSCRVKFKMPFPAY